MLSSDDARQALAQRLRTLREEQWPDRKITQAKLAAALHVSASLISAWESPTNPQLPSLNRLKSYATFFAAEERGATDELLVELTQLRAAVIRESPESAEALRGFWQFSDPSQSVTIIASELPSAVRQAMPDPDPDGPDYVQMYNYSDLDALFELHGHIKATNPANPVNLRTPSELTNDDFTTHLVLLGGVDWNAITAEMTTQWLDIPVRQNVREKATDASGFEVMGEKPLLFEPRLQVSGNRRVLVEDVAHVYRGQNPFREQRTLTICNGMHGRGTYGAVRALTDPAFRDENESYLRERFGYRLETLSIVTRVRIIHGEVITPDWTSMRNRLHEWPEASA